MFLTYCFLSEKNSILTNNMLLIIILTLFSIIIREQELLQAIAHELILVSTVIIIHSVFYNNINNEFNSGITEQLLIQPISFEFFLFKRVMQNSFFYQVSILIIMPLLTVLANISTYKLLGALWVSIPAIMSLSLIGSVIALHKTNSRIAMSIITLPLLIPVLILADSIIHNGNLTQLLLLLTIIMATIPVNIIASCYLIKINV